MISSYQLLQKILTIINFYVYSTSDNSVCVASTVPACEKFLDNKTVPPVQFFCMDIELVSSLIPSLDAHKTTEADGILLNLLGLHRI